MKDKYSGLSNEERLKRYKKENLTLLISAIICSIVIIVISILFFVYELDKTISIGFLLLLPFSWWIGYYIPKKENDKKIKELENKIMEDWRLIGNFGYIIGHNFRKTKFKSNGKNDHEHCVFCWTKITDIEIEEPHLVEGYVTISKKTNQENWVCEKCYLDFKDKFGFTDQE